MENEKANEIYSKVVRAGKRTYFFDIKATKNNDFYLTITESKKSTNHDGSEQFQKHKLFLYKEDFEKFKEGLEDVLLKIDTLKDGSGEQNAELNHTTPPTSFSFEDL
jgi:hypothetical protein